MKETAFIKKNKEKWFAFEQAISGKNKKKSDELAKLYIQIMNDLSFAQTFYPKSKTTIYLNHLATQIYQKIYKTKRTERNFLKHFFLEEVPLLSYKYRKYFLISFILFAVFTFIGALSARYDQDFVRLILGDGYVNMTLENIKNGNPVAVYGSELNSVSFISITVNNLLVGAKCYVYGIFAGLGTFYISIYNGIMLGSFQYFFYQEKVLLASMLGIWIHGAMEIFTIIIESAAGLILGASILFPKSYSRLNSLKIGFKNSFKIYVSTYPFVIAAGFLEGYVTRYSKQMPMVLNLLIIFVTFAIISFYYIIYPQILNNKKTSNYVSAL